MKYKEITKEYTLSNPAASGRKLTLVADLQPKLVYGVPPASSKEAVEIKECGTRLSVGWALKDPTDTTSPEDLGIRIARGRRDKTPLFSMTLKSPRVSEQFSSSILDLVAKEFDERFYSFVPLGSNGKNKKKTLEEGKSEEVIHTKEESRKA